jgi:amino acid transporter
VLAATGNHNPKKGVVQAIALATAWLVTLLHALGRMAGIHLNSAFAVTKISMLIMMIILGFIVLNNHTSHMHRDPGSYSNLDTKTSFKHLGRVDNARGFATSYLNIVFTFGGWNQANYVCFIPFNFRAS